MGRYSKGDRVRSTNWDHVHIGTVLGSDEDSVFVNWDNTSFEDERDLGQVEPLPPDER